MKKSVCFLILTFALIEKASAFFNDRISVQGYFKASGAALNDVAGFPMQYIIKKNGTAVWCQTSVAPVPVVSGIFAQSLTGNSNCSSLTNPLGPSTFSHTSNSDVFSVDVKVDLSKDGFGGADDATFAGIELVSNPLAIYANQAEVATSLSGVLGLANGGTGAVTAAAARINLGLGPLSTLALSGTASDVLKGDGSFGSVSGLVSSVAGKSGAVTLQSVDITDAVSTNTANSLVLRDPTGNFSAGTITASLSGNSTNVTGTVALANGGTGAVTASAARANLGLGALAVLTTTGSIGDVLRGDGTFGVPTGVVNSVAGRSGTVTLASADITDAVSTNTVSTLVLRNASGNFSAGTITAALSGNATNVTGTVAVANGGTGASAAAAARTNLGAAASGANTDITSITGTARQAQTLSALSTAGTTTAYTLTLAPALAAYSTGLTISMRINATNTGAATLNVNGLGVRSIFSGLTGAAVAAGDLVTGKYINLSFDGTNFVADIQPRYFSATALNCGASVVASSFVTCPNIAATNVNAGDIVHCSPSADPAAGSVTWSALATAGNISIRFSCSNGASACALTSRNWRCAILK